MPAPGEQIKAADPPPLSPCLLRLREHAVVRPLADIAGPGECAAADVVEIDGIVLRDGRQVQVTPAAVSRCEMAEAVADWVRDDLAPMSVAYFGAPLREIEEADSYSCRGRNNVPGAKLSEHGKANAFDLAALNLADGRVAHPTDRDISSDFRDGMRLSACLRFRTVLGPGSDGFHEDHIHVDLAARHNGYRLCQWNVTEPLIANAPAERLGGPAVSVVRGDSSEAVPLPKEAAHRGTLSGRL